MKIKNFEEFKDPVNEGISSWYEGMFKDRWYRKNLSVEDARRLYDELEMERATAKGPPSNSEKIEGSMWVLEDSSGDEIIHLFYKEGSFRVAVLDESLKSKVDSILRKIK